MGSMSGRFGWNTEHRHFFRSALLILCSFILAHSLTFAFGGLFDTWDNQLKDRFFRLRYRLLGKQEVSPYLIHVVINDSTHRILGLSSWDRTVFGRVIDVLRRADADTVACDVFFKDRSTLSNDGPLLEALARAGNVILPVLLEPGEAPVSGDGAASEAENRAAEAKSLLHPVIKGWGNPPVGATLVVPFRQAQETASGFGHINGFVVEGGIVGGHSDTALKPGLVEDRNCLLGCGVADGYLCGICRVLDRKFCMGRPGPYGLEVF